jgi:ABC-type sugar transport system permease subunit
MGIVNTKKQVKYLSTEQSVMVRQKLEHTMVDLEAQMKAVSDHYVKLATKARDKKSKNVGKVLALSKKRNRIYGKIQHIKIELFRLEEGTLEQLNPFQKIKKRFAMLTYRQQKVVFGIMFVIPWLIGFCVFFASPVFSTIWWSLNKMTLQSGGGFQYEFVGFGNYLALFTSETLAGSTVLEVLTSSILNIGIDLPTILIFSLFIAVLLNTRFKGHQFVKAIFFIPVIYNMSVISNTLLGTFGQLFDSKLNEGFILSAQFSGFLMQIGIGQGLVEFLTSAVDRIFMIVNMSGIQILIFIAALQSISTHLYEAAKMEGATKYEMFWKITIPMISPMILTAVVYTIVDSFATSDIIRFMTINSQGTTMATNQPGLYSAISIIYFLANGLIIAFVFGLMRKVVFYHD